MSGFHQKAVQRSEAQIKQKTLASKQVGRPAAHHGGFSSEPCV